MAFAVAVTDDEVRVDLTGWDRMHCWRRRQVFARSLIRAARVDGRGPLEERIQHRAWGYGTHDGGKRPGRRRVGSMLGPAARGAQFWAVSAGPADATLLVLELAGGSFVRAVLEVDDPHDTAAQLTG